MRPKIEEYAPYYKKYVEKVTGNNPIEFLESQIKIMQSLVGRIDEERSNYRYAEGKWSIREVIGHIIDSERVFSYRVLRFSRKDLNPLPGFDENAYIEKSCYHDTSFGNLVEEFILLRKANILLFSRLNEEAINQIGNASGYDVSVRALLYITAGHTQHHIDIIKEKYLDNK